jgi:hypothetical protein
VAEGAKMKGWVLLFAVLVLGCAEPEATEKLGRDSAYKVDRLFTKDDYAVYRFHDEGRYHYFVIPAGQAITSHRDGSEIIVTK